MLGDGFGVGCSLTEGLGVEDASGAGRCGFNTGGVDEGEGCTGGLGVTVAKGVAVREGVGVGVAVGFGVIIMLAASEKLPPSWVATMLS